MLNIEQINKTFRSNNSNQTKLKKDSNPSVDLKII